nr:hypothetical protein [Tanacetum cinerariifolium]
HATLYVIDIEKTLKLAEVSRLNMHAKQNDLIMQERKVNIATIDYVALNKLSGHFVKHCVPQKQLSVEQAFWLPISKLVFKIPPVQPESVLKEIPRELPTISLVKDSFNKIRNHVDDFENVVTVRTKVTGQNEGSWGFEHIRKAFNKDVKPFVETIKDYFYMFDQAEIIDYQSMEKSFLDEYSEEAHVDYLKYTHEHADTLREIVEHARALRPLDSDLDSTCQTFTVDENTCPLTRITSTIVVPPKKPILTTVVKKTSPSSNTSGKLKDITNIGSSSKSKNVESKISNNSEPNNN